MPLERLTPPDVNRRLFGCQPLTESDRLRLSAVKASAISLKNCWEITEDGVLPILAYDDEFEALLDSRVQKLDALRDAGRATEPWEILANLSAEERRSTRLFINQGQRDSCANHALDHAFCCSLLSEIALGAPLVYESFNGIYGHYVSKGERMAGGQTIPDTAEFANQHGLYPESLVGEDNQSTPRDYAQFNDAAKTFQAAIVYLGSSGLAEKVTRCVHAGFGVALGNSLAVAGDTTDDNGVPTPIFRGGWAHATSFVAYRKIKGTEYVFWANSWGDIYSPYDTCPAAGLWMPTAKAQQFLISAAGYGDPFAVIPRSTVRPDWRLHL